MPPHSLSLSFSGNNQRRGAVSVHVSLPTTGPPLLTKCVRVEGFFLLPDKRTNPTDDQNPTIGVHESVVNRLRDDVCPLFSMRVARPGAAAMCGRRERIKKNDGIGRCPCSSPFSGKKIRADVDTARSFFG